MNEFKVGDKVWLCYTDGSSQSEGMLGGRFYGLGHNNPVEIKRIGPYEEGSRDVLWDRTGLWFRPEDVFRTKREALAEVIRQNEMLASELTMEIARLKEELGSCQD